MHTGLPVRDEASGAFTDEAWDEWKQSTIKIYKETREAVPEVDFAYINFQPGVSVEFIEKFAEYKAREQELQSFTFGYNL
jgi:hypothetical protein